MRVLIVNVFRERGSTGKIVSCLGSYLTDAGDDVFYAFRDGKKLGKNDFRIGNRIETALTHKLNYFFGTVYGFAFFSTFKLKRLIKNKQPDIVSFHSLNGSYINIPRLIRWLSKKGIAFTVTNHSEYLTGNCVHSNDCQQWITGCYKCNETRNKHLSLLFDTTRFNYNRMKKAFSQSKKAVVISVSPWVYKRSCQSTILHSIPQTVIRNGIDESVFFPRVDDRFRSKIACTDEKIVLFLSASFSDKTDDEKGGRYVIEIAKRLLLERIKIVVVALENKCSSIIPDNIKVLGSISDQSELSRVYSSADVLLLTSRRETFSMPTAEALMCGTPVVGFEAGGPESIALPDFSSFVDYGNVDLLIKELHIMLNKRFDREMIHKKAVIQYSNTKMCKAYRAVFESLLKTSN